MYFESHITIEPVFEEQLERAQQLAAMRNFKVAKLLMKKRSDDTAERSQYDTFMTGHDSTYAELDSRMVSLVRDLKDSGYKVWRYKIEDIVIDSRIHDVHGLIDKKE